MYLSNTLYYTFREYITKSDQAKVIVCWEIEINKL